jgi:hypothetical protein
VSGEGGQDDAVTARLRGFAAQAVDDPAAAGEHLADWAGRRPSPAGEARLRQMARLAPRLLADEIARAGWAGPDGMWVPRLATDTLPPEIAAVTQAVTRHLNDEHDIAEQIIDAYTAPRGLAGLWTIGTTALRLLTAELRDQRTDPA